MRRFAPWVFLTLGLAVALLAPGCIGDNIEAAADDAIQECRAAVEKAQAACILQVAGAVAVCTADHRDFAFTEAGCVEDQSKPLGWDCQPSILCEVSP